MNCFSPRNEDDIVQLVKASADRQEPLSISGGNTRLGLGRPVSSINEVSLKGLSGITLYEPEELVISARVGTPLTEITEQLDLHGQELAFEPLSHAALYERDGSQSTLGGLVSVNASGPRRIKVGAARDHLLGFRAVNGRGEIFQSGGRVMKNVTGYDLSKLMAGSFGTLGILTEVTLKTLPKAPSESTVLVTDWDDATAISALTRASGLSLEVSSLAHIPANAALAAVSSVNRLHGRALTCFRIEGPEVSVGDRTLKLRRELGGNREYKVLNGLSSKAFWSSIRDVGPLRGLPGTVWRISTAPANGCRLVAGLLERELAIKAHYYDWAGGLVWLVLEGEDSDSAIAIRDELARWGGHATLVRASDAFRMSVDVFQPQAPSLAALTARVRQSFDPLMIFNRGRVREDL